MSKKKHNPEPELFEAETGEVAAEETAVAVEEKKPFDPLHDEHGPLKSLVDFNFLQYASYVICDRAIPALEDGLKPVQRRILHALKEKDDGRFIKVANIVGHTMHTGGS
jgi:topoisomerase-4 subunit A